LPTRPPKDSDWAGSECVELNTMPPAELRRFVQEAIASLIDEHKWKQMERTEKLENRTANKTLAPLLKPRRMR
jgi:hypothetical protein